tara:strand:+ start:54 stop:329 length:276 start_codon:yes stop_codon:yes gene_type:complete
MRQEKLCVDCNNWTDSKLKSCRYCGVELFEKERINRQKIAAQPDPFKINLLKIYAKDSYLIIFGKRIIQFVQIVFFGIISILIWIASLLPG